MAGPMGSGGEGWMLIGSQGRLCTELIGELALAGSTNKCRPSSLASNIETLDAVIEPYLMTLKFLMKQVTGNKSIQSLLCM